MDEHKDDPQKRYPEIIVSSYSSHLKWKRRDEKLELAKEYWGKKYNQDCFMSV